MIDIQNETKPADLEGYLLTSEHRIHIVASRL